MSRKMPPGWLSTKLAAAQIGVSPKTVERWIRIGLLPASMFGHTLRIRTEDWHEFLAKSRLEK